MSSVNETVDDPLNRLEDDEAEDDEEEEVEDPDKLIEELKAIEEYTTQIYRRVRTRETYDEEELATLMDVFKKCAKERKGTIPVEDTTVTRMRVTLQSNWRGLQKFRENYEIAASGDLEITWKLLQELAVFMSAALRVIENLSNFAAIGPLFEAFDDILGRVRTTRPTRLKEITDITEAIALCVAERDEDTRMTRHLIKLQKFAQNYKTSYQDDGEAMLIGLAMIVSEIRVDKGCMPLTWLCVRFERPFEIDGTTYT